MAIKVLSSLGHIGCPNLGPRQTSDPSDVEVGASTHTGISAQPLWHLPRQYQPQIKWSFGHACCLLLELLLPLPSCAGSLLLLCCWHAAGLLQPVRDKVGPVHSSAALPGMICLSLAVSLLLCTVCGGQRGRRGQQLAGKRGRDH